MSIANRYGRKKSHEAITLVCQPDAVSQWSSKANYGSDNDQRPRNLIAGDRHKILACEVLVSGVLMIMRGISAAAGGFPTIPEFLRLVIGLLPLLVGYGLTIWGVGVFFDLPPFGKRRFLRPVVWARFQFVVFTGVALKVDDLLFGLADFRHSASPAEISDSVEPACWTRDAEASASSNASASCYCAPEDVGILAIVVAELKLVQVERQIFFAELW